MILVQATAVLILGCTTASAQDDSFKSIFNGKDLKGWDGNPDLWSVENGVITGKTTGPAQLKYNQFLIWRGGKVKNFEFRAKVKHTGNNSGIQYRSKELPAIGKWSVGGYQCDLHPNAPYNAMIYEERGRGITVTNGQGVVADPEGKRWITDQRDPVKVDTAQWHEYSIIAKGNHIVHKIDGKMTIEFHDFDEKARSLEGVLAFQVHRGPAMNVQIKDVRLKVLPDGGVIDFKNFAIPSDAHVIEKKKPTPKKKKPAPKKKQAAKSKKK